MEKIHFASYGNNKYENARKRIFNEALNSDFFDSIKVYGYDDLDENFKNEFSDILNMPRGGGYWCWKIHVMLKRLNEIKDGDILFYCDSGCQINKNGAKRFKQYIKMLKNSNNEYFINFELKDLPEKNWTIKEIFQLFNIVDDKKITDSNQLVGGIQFIKKNNESMKILNNIYQIIKNNKLLITDYYNNKNQNKCFIDARHDQSIFSVSYKLLKKSIIIPDETYFNNFNSPEALQHPILAKRLN